MLSLPRATFDLAVTLDKPGPRAAEVRHLTDYGLRFYASREYLDRWGEPETFDEFRERLDLI